MFTRDHSAQRWAVSVGIAVIIARPLHGTSGISGGARALQVNTRELESMPGSDRPPFPIRPGETPSRRARTQVAYTLNFRSSNAVMSRRFTRAGIRQPPPPMAAEPYAFGWIPLRGRRPLTRKPPREYTQQLASDLESQNDKYRDPYNPQVPTA